MTERKDVYKRQTVLCNSIGMIAGGNTVVFNPHPNALMTSLYAVDLINRAAIEAGLPQNMCCAVAKPTMETSDIMVKHPYIKMLLSLIHISRCWARFLLKFRRSSVWVMWT